MEWTHVDLDAAQWRYLVTKTKTALTGSNKRRYALRLSALIDAK